MPATFKMTSLGEVHPESFPVSLTPITRGHLSSKGCQPSHRQHLLRLRQYRGHQDLH